MSPGPDWSVPVPDTGRLDSSAQIARAQLAQKTKRHPPSRDKLRESFRKQVGVGAAWDTFPGLLRTSSFHASAWCPEGNRESGKPAGGGSGTGPGEQQRPAVQHLVPVSRQPATPHQRLRHPSRLRHRHHALILQILRVQEVQKEISGFQVNSSLLFCPGVA